MVHLLHGRDVILLQRSPFHVLDPVRPHLPRQFGTAPHKPTNLAPPQYEQVIDFGWYALHSFLGIST